MKKFIMKLLKIDVKFTQLKTYKLSEEYDILTQILKKKVLFFEHTIPFTEEQRFNGRNFVYFIWNNKIMSVGLHNFALKKQYEETQGIGKSILEFGFREDMKVVLGGYKFFIVKFMLKWQMFKIERFSKFRVKKLHSLDFENNYTIQKRFLLWYNNIILVDAKIENEASINVPISGSKEDFLKLMNFFNKCESVDRKIHWDTMQKILDSIHEEDKTEAKKRIEITYHRKHYTNVF